MNQIIRLEAVNLHKCFSFWDFERNMEKRKRIENDIVSGKRTMFVYVYAEEYVAGISLSIMKKDTCLISYLAVEEGYRNKGIGTSLIKFVCNYAMNHDSKRVLLEVDFENMGAKKLYQKMGFSEKKISPQGRVRMVKYLEK